VPTEDFHGGFSGETGPSATCTEKTTHKSVTAGLKMFHSANQFNLSEGLGVHFVDVFPLAGDVFDICLPLFLQV